MPCPAATPMPPNAALRKGKTYRNPGFPGDAGHALDAREAHGAGRTREALDAAGAIGTLDALGAQLPSTASLEGTRRRRVRREQWGQCRPRPPPPPAPRHARGRLLWILSWERPAATYLSFGSDRATGTLQESGCLTRCWVGAPHAGRGGEDRDGPRNHHGAA